VLSVIQGIHRCEERMRLAQEEQVVSSKMNSRALAKLSHDIRTPLNNIIVVSNILSNACAHDSHGAELVQTIQTSANSLVSVLNGLENLAIADIKPETDLQISFDLDRTLGSITQLAHQLHPGLSCTHRIAPGLPKSFVGDPIHIKQIALNVLESISQHKVASRASVSINVRGSDVRPNGLRFEFNVSEPLHLAVAPVGKPIQQGDHNALISALDLALSQLLVQKNGGAVHVDIGSTSSQISFDYRLDSHDVNLPLPPQPSKKEEPMSQPPLELSQAHVLLVEDNQINQKIVMLSLGKLVKSVEVANNGREALDKFATNRYDIILMDIQMPIMNGFVTTKKIRELEVSIHAHTPIIAITANALMGDREQCLEAGMDDYISKPFQVEVLVEKMERLLGAKP
ncbi:MAG: response regulator, partial [Bacteroidales bacterium]|nr:response regulator [Bacteroidales bacterium]